MDEVRMQEEKQDAFVSPTPITPAEGRAQAQAHHHHNQKILLRCQYYQVDDCLLIHCNTTIFHLNKCTVSIKVSKRPNQVQLLEKLHEQLPNFKIVCGLCGQCLARDQSINFIPAHATFGEVEHSCNLNLVWFWLPSQKGFVITCLMKQNHIYKLA